MRKYKYKVGDEEFRKKVEAINRRNNLNDFIHKANTDDGSPINLRNVVLRNKSGGWFVRGITKRK